MRKRAVFDVETVPNRCMVGFMDLDTEKITQFEHNQGKGIAKHIRKREIIGFNSKNYDNLMVTAMIRGKNTDELYNISKDLVEGGGKRWDYANYIQHDIDLMEVAKGQASLKLYGARLNAEKLQDLPYHHDEPHTKKMWKNVCKYNVNDLKLTELLYNFLLPQLKLREKVGKQYGINVMSRSDAQMGEDIFRVELKKRGIDVKKAVKNKTIPPYVTYTAPKSVKFKRKDLNKLVKRIEKSEIEIGGGGAPMIPKWLKDEKIIIGGGVYNIGLGGLHSTEKSTAVTPPKGKKLGNVDVAAMYPSLNLEMGLYPEHLGKTFLDIYQEMYDVRKEVKKIPKPDRTEDEATTDATYKIVLNGAGYGKLGSIYSFLYSPENLLAITFTGQLQLLMLIETFERKGMRVVSANTDGIEFIYEDIKLVEKLVKKWEKKTGLVMEYGEYNALYSRDVNSYIAVYDGYVKRKGFYSEPKIDKNNEYLIVIDAIAEFLLNGTPMEKTIRKCKDIAKFCVSRQVTGGALWSPEEYENTEEYENYMIRKAEGVKWKQNKALEKRNDNFKKQFVLMDADQWYIGKVVRYYYANEGKPMFYKKSGNRVPKSDGCKPMMKLSKKIPKDLDYGKYIELANTHLKELGYE